MFFLHQTSLAMSSNLESMPGCAGMKQPISEWLERGLTCDECAWEAYCLEYAKENLEANLIQNQDVVEVLGQEPTSNK